MKRADTLAEIKKSLNPKPLLPEELPEFFVETSRARDPFASRRAELFDRLAAKTDAKVLLAGHAGSGKSTELVKFRSEHDAEYFSVQFSMVEEGEPGNSTVEALLVLIIETILRGMSAFGASLSEETLKAIYGWFDETFQVDESELRYTGSLGGGLQADDTWWGKLLGIMAFVKADIRTGSGLLSKTITRDNKRLSQLAYQCGLLVKEAQLAVRQGDGRELLLIVEDLDKIDVDEADRLFVENPAPLAGLPCKAVFTAPIFLFCNPRAVVLESYFQTVTLPMIKTEDLEGRRAADGWEVITAILDHRVDLERCIDAEAIELAISKTGGVLRHLFTVLQQATTAAGQSADPEGETQRIAKAHVRYGLNRLKSDLLRRIGVMGLPEEFEGITTAQLYERLGELAGRPQRVVSDRINLLLLQAHALIEYNGDQWHRVHPLVAEHVEATRKT